MNRDDPNANMMVGSNFKVGKKLGAGNFGELSLGNNITSMEVIILKETPKMAFEKIVEFIYTGECDISFLGGGEIVELICLAHLYQYSQLFEILKQKLTITNQSPIEFVAALLHLHGLW